MFGGISNMGYGYYGYGYRSRYSSASAMKGAGGMAATQRAAEVSPVRGAAGGRVAAIPAAQPESPVQPVSPVPAVSSDTPLDKADLLRRLETDPAAMAVRSRIRYTVNNNGEASGQAQAAGNVAVPQSVPAQAMGNEQALPFAAAQMPEDGQAGPQELANHGLIPGQDSNLPGVNGQKEAEKAGSTEESKSAQDVMEESECQTCKNRKYQDGSDDPGVSFKTPSHVSPEMAASAVRGHENEHVVRERAKADMEDRKVVSQSVTYHTAICPECGKVYVSGGTTRTVTAANGEEPYQDQAQEKENDQPTGASSLFGAE